MRLSDFFTLTDEVAVLRLRKEIRAIQAAFTPSERASRYFRLQAVEQGWERVAATYQDLIPLKDGRKHTSPNENERHFLETTPYIHPATFSYMARLAGFEVEVFTKWICGFISFEGEEIQEHYHYTPNYSLEEIKKTWAERVSPSFWEESGFTPEDFYWDVVPVPPSAHFALRQSTDGTYHHAPYHQTLNDLIRRNSHTTYGSEGFRLYTASLYRYIEVVMHPEYASLWQLTPFERFTLPFPPLSPYFLPVVPLTYLPNLPEKPAPEENAYIPPTPYAIALLHAEMGMRQEDNLLSFFDLSTGEVKETAHLPHSYCPFYKKSGNRLYFYTPDGQGLYAFDEEKFDFVEENTRHPEYSYEEVYERAMLNCSIAPTSYHLTEVADYPVVYLFDSEKKYFYCIDKEDSGGIYHLETGLLLTKTPLYNVEKSPSFSHIQEEGNISPVNNEEEDDTEEELWDELMERQEQEEEAWQSPSRPSKMDAFGCYQSHWLIVVDRYVYYQKKKIAFIAFPYSWVEFEPQSGILYLENSTFCRKIDLRPLLAISTEE